METVPGNRTIGAGRRYQRHQPENTPLYPIGEQHLPALRDELQRHEVLLPRFVLTEFQDYLRCGRLEYGFVRVMCDGCRHEHLVAFSCKRRGFCPSCGASGCTDIGGSKALFSGIAVADFDGDGLPDIAMSNGALSCLFNDPANPGTFRAAQSVDVR